MISKLAMTAAAVGTAFVLAGAPAQAQHWRGHHGGGWHRGGGVGAGIAGFAAGALLGGALAGPRYYGGYGYGPGYYDYDYAPGVVEVPSGGDAEAYCEQRFRSYDPASGTYLGYDGMRHPCP